MIDGENGGDGSVDPTCVGWWVGERWNEEVYSKGGVHVEKTVCNFKRWGSTCRWSGDGDNRRESSTARRLNRDQLKKTAEW